MSIFLGIEGVGLRHSVAVAADENGRILSAYRMLGEPIALHTADRKLLRTRLIMLMKEVASRAGRRLDNLQDATICIGLTGVTFPYDAEVDLPGEFSRLKVNVERLICTGDAEIVFASHAQTSTGSGIICQMGSTAFVMTPEKSIRFGGWGPAIGDEGSGYWIGREALRVISEEYGLSERPSDLWQAIDHWLARPNIAFYSDWEYASILWREYRERYQNENASYDLRTAIFSFSQAMSLQTNWQWRAVLSSLATPVIKSWEAGNEQANKIVHRAVEHLVHQYKGACARAKMAGPVSPLVLYGGVLTHNPKFRDLLQTRLIQELHLPKKILTAASPGTMRPACGALLFALGKSSTGYLRLPSEKIINTLVNDQAQFHKVGELIND